MIPAAEVLRLLAMPDCVRLMRAALAALARGEAVMPLRTVMRTPAGFLGVMPGHLAAQNGAPALGLKGVTVFPGNAARGLETHQGAVMLFDAETGIPSAIMDAAPVTAVRTAAVSAVATDCLAGAQAGDLAILGAGVQARTHIEAMAAVRRVRRARIWSRNFEHARRLADEAGRTYPFPIHACQTAAEAVAGSDIVCTVTASAEPVLERQWLSDGVHVNAVGASQPSARELDTDTVKAARLFVDRRESALAEAGDILIPLRSGEISEAHIAAELGEVVAGLKPGRLSDGEITVFKSLGLAVEDLAAARYVADRAAAAGLGTTVDL